MYLRLARILRKNGVRSVIMKKVKQKKSGKDGSAIIEYALICAMVVTVLVPILWPYPDNKFYKAIQNVYRREVIIVGMPGL